MTSSIVSLLPDRYLDVRRGKYIQSPIISVSGLYITALDGNYSKKNTIDLKGITLLPGLIDTHVHITYTFPENDSIKENQRKTLYAGFTTVRDLGSEKIIDVNEDDISPYILWSGKPIFKKDLNSKSIDQLLSERKKSDYIKIFENKNDLIGADTLKRIVNKSSVPVAIHAIYPEEIEQANRSGCRSIEHCSFVNAETFIDNGTYVCPTFSNPSQYLNNFSKYSFMFGDNNSKVRDYFTQIQKNNIKNIKKIWPSKCNIVFGTDSVAGMHGNNHYEFSFMSQLGMSPIQMIQSATCDAADMLEQDKIGEIKIDAYADLIGVKGNPLRDINDLKNIEFIMKGGKVFKM